MSINVIVLISVMAIVGVVLVYIVKSMYNSIINRIEKINDRLSYLLTDVNGIDANLGSKIDNINLVLDVITLKTNSEGLISKLNEKTNYGSCPNCDTGYYVNLFCPHCEASEVFTIE